MYDTRGDIVDALAGMPEVLNHLALTLAGSAGSPIARPGEWALVQIVCHLRDAEERALERTRRMRDSDHPEISSYDPSAWAIERDYGSQDLAAALATFRTFRESHVSDLGAIPWPDWHRQGSHAEYGAIDILGHAIHVVSHDAIHLLQIVQLGR